MNYAIFGPFNLQEARTLSTSDPMECIPEEWGDRTHLESVGSSCLYLGGVERKLECTSKHFGRKFSTIIYHDAMMVLCQLDNPLNGVYVCSEEMHSLLSGGFKKLIEEKLNAESELNKALNERKMFLKQRMEALPNLSASYVQKIKDSEILDSPNVGVLSNLTSKLKPLILSGTQTIEYIGRFYSPEIFGRNIHMGTALYHLGLPTDNMLKSAVGEHLEAFRDMVPAENAIFFKEELRKNPENIFA